MKIVFVDYSETYYRGLVRTGVPDRNAGKFVQIRKGAREYLVFSPREFTRFHADIVSRFCKDHNIAGVFNGRSKSFEIHDPSWVVTGGGKFEMHRRKKLLHLYDNSMAYGKFDRRGLREKLFTVRELSDYEVRIE